MVLSLSLIHILKLTRTQEFDLYAFSEESLSEELNTENKEAEHVKDVNT